LLLARDNIEVLNRTLIQPILCVFGRRWLSVLLWQPSQGERAANGLFSGGAALLM
jgi:hypothetical protein